MKINNLKFDKRFLAGLIMTPVLAFSGCGKSDCDMVEYHLHKYEKGGFVRYIDDEHLDVDGFNWTDELIYVKEADKDLYKIERKKHLMKIDDNVDALIASTGQYNEYLEYEYKKKTKHHQKIGDTDTTYYTTSYHWTTDYEHSKLTGKVRLLRYFYKSYNVIKNDKGKYILVDGIESDNINDIIDKKDEFPYISVDIAKAKVICEGTLDDKGYASFDNDEKIYSKK